VVEPHYLLDDVGLQGVVRIWKLWKLAPLHAAVITRQSIKDNELTHAGGPPLDLMLS
jgi:hypothetical protein